LNAHFEVYTDSPENAGRIAAHPDVVRVVTEPATFPASIRILVRVRHERWRRHIQENGDDLTLAVQLAGYLSRRA
jgi:hypothetical protein